MKVLISNGSPKKERSNTFKLTKSFLEGMKEIEHIEEEIINIADKNIKACLGCFVCWKKTPGKCVHQDDMKDLLPKLLEADVVIWSFPLYYFGMPSEIKAFMDRMLPLNLPFINENEGGTPSHPPRYQRVKEVKHVLISTCGFFSTKGNFKGLVKQFEICFGHWNNGKNLEKILCPEGELFRVPQLSKRTNEYLEYVKQAGKDYAFDFENSSLTREKLDELLYPVDTFIQMADASWGVPDTRGREAVDMNSAQPVQKVENAPIALNFIKQTAALYNKEMWHKKDIVLEINYIDLNETYQVILQENGSKVLDDKSQLLPFTAKVETTLDVWKDIGAGKLDRIQALSERKFKIFGDLAFMSQWELYFGGSSKPKKETKKEKHSNVLVLLIPWLFVWIAIPFDPFWGSFIALLGSTATLLSYFIVKLSPYDIISILVCALISALGIAGIDIMILSPLAYLLLGLMWLISAFTKIPLTA